jgi:hypothetical protein
MSTDFPKNNEHPTHMMNDNEAAVVIAAMQLQSTRGGDNATVTARLLRALVQGLGAISATLTVLSEAGSDGPCGVGSTAALVGSTNTPEWALGSSIELHATMLGQVIEDGVPCLFNGGFEAVLQPPAAALASCRTAASALCWPLRFQSMRAGALTLHRGARAAPFTPADLSKGVVFTAVLAVLLENARLNSQHHPRISRLQSVNRELREINKQLMAALVCAANELKSTPASMAQKASASERLHWIPKAVFLQGPSR